jgi:hypothetical protein
MEDQRPEDAEKGIDAMVHAMGLRLRTLERSELEKEAMQRGVPLQVDKSNQDYIKEIQCDLSLCTVNLERAANDFSEEKSRAALQAACQAKTKTAACYRLMLANRLWRKSGCDGQKPSPWDYGLMGDWPCQHGERLLSLQYNSAADKHAGKALPGSEEDKAEYLHRIMDALGKQSA